jgi:hypothetical protein
MGNDKSILEKFTDTVKGIAETATNAASQALKAEQPPMREEDLAALSMPLAGDGFVSDPMLVPPAAAAAPRPRKRVAPRRSAGKVRKAAKTAGKKAAAEKAARKVAKKSAVARSRTAAKKTAKRTTKSGARTKKARQAARRSR